MLVGRNLCASSSSNVAARTLPVVLLLLPNDYDTSDLVKRDTEHIVLRWQDITHGSPGWAVHQRGGETKGPDGWVVRQVFTETPQYPVDYAVGNHFVATHDRSPFSPVRTSSGGASTGTTRSTRWSGRRNAQAGTG